MKYLISILLLASLVLTACTGSATRTLDDSTLQLDTKTRGSVSTSTSSSSSSSGGGGGTPINESNESITYLNVYSSLSRHQFLNYIDEDEINLYVNGYLTTLSPVKVTESISCYDNEGIINSRIDYQGASFYSGEGTYVVQTNYDDENEAYNGKAINCFMNAYTESDYKNRVYDFYSVNSEEYTLITVNDANLLTSPLTGEKYVYVDASNEVGGIESVYVTVTVTRLDGSSLFHSASINYPVGEYPNSITEFIPLDYDLTNAEFVNLRINAYTPNNLRTSAYAWYEMNVTNSTITLNRDGKQETFENSLVLRTDSQEELVTKAKKEISDELVAEAKP